MRERGRDEEDRKGWEGVDVSKTARGNLESVLVTRVERTLWYEMVSIIAPVISESSTVRIIFSLSEREWQISRQATKKQRQ